ncbi:MAG: hypothetical protein WC770_03820 [Phycisphaerae bacterium]|jgi:hypothetical protein
MKNYSEKIEAAEPKRQRREQYIKRASLFALAFIVFLIALWIIDLFKTPANFRKVKPIQGEHISLYLSNYIMPELHNKSQYNEPFDLVLSQAGVNEILARHIDPNTLAKVGLSDLSARFKKGEIVLTAKTNYKGFNFIVSMTIEPRIDKNEKLVPGIGNFEVGRSSLPFVAGVIKKKIINSLSENFNAEKNNEFINTVLTTGKIDPVFNINHSKLRIEKITVQNEELRIHFLPEHNG